MLPGGDLSWAWLGIFLVLLSWPAKAQGPTEAAMRGRVVDARGALIAGADVGVWAAGGDSGTAHLGTAHFGTVSSPVTGFGAMRPRVVRTDRQGGYLLVGLEPGAYDVAVALREGLGQIGPVVVEAEAGEVTETELRVGEGFPWLLLSATPLDVGAAFVVQPSDVVLGRAGVSDIATSAKESKEAADLWSRDWEVSSGRGSAEWIDGAAHGATLADGGSVQGDTEGENDTPAARADREEGSRTSGGAGVSFDGMPGTENASSVDGLSADSGFSGEVRGGGASGLSSAAGFESAGGFARGSGRLVKSMPQTFSAQYGGAGGTVVVHSRGSLEEGLHGKAYVTARQSGWAAVNPFAVVTRYNGGAVTTALERPGSSTIRGGTTLNLPLKLPGWMREWRSGLGLSGEVQERAETLVSTPLTAGFYDLTAGQRALLGNRGVSTAATKAALEYLDGLTGTAAVRSPMMSGQARFDVAPSQRDRVILGVRIGRETTPVTAGGGSAEGLIDSAVSSIGTRNVDVEEYTAQWQRTLGARASNSLRAQFVHELEDETPPTPSEGVPGVGPGGYAPQVSIQPEGFTYGTPASLGRVAYPDEQRLEVADSVALRLGRHLVTVGADWSRVHDEVLNATDVEGAFSYNNTTASGHDGGLVDWITDSTFNVGAYPNGGCPSVFATVHYFCFHSYSQGFTGAATEFVTHQFAGFAEDSVRLRRDLLMTAGVRYDYLLLPFPQQPNAALDGVLRQFSGFVQGVTSSFPEDRNNFGPRLSVTWSPRRRDRRWFTAHVGYGAFYGRLPGATIDAALAETGLPSSTTRIRITPKTETDCPQVPNQGFGYPCAFLSVPTGVAAQTASSLVFATNFRLPAVQRAELGLDREFGRRLRVHAGYATAWATQLPESVDMNIAPATGNVTYVIQGGDVPGSVWAGLRTGETFVLPEYSARRSTAYGPVTALVSNTNATYHSGTIGAEFEAFHGWSARGSYTFSRAIDDGPQSSATPRENGQFDPFAVGYDKGLSSFQLRDHFSGTLSFRSSMAGGPREIRAVVVGWSFAAVGTAQSGLPYSYGVYGGTRLTGGRMSLNGSGGAAYLPTVGRNTLRLPPRGLVNLRTMRDLPVRGRLRLQVQGEAFNLLNSVSVSRVEARAFLLGTPATAGGPIPLVFQNAATIAAEGLTTQAFGTRLSSTSGVSRERQIEMGLRLSF